MLKRLLDEAQAIHQARFGDAPTWVASAPGRVNLIGDHTDYTDGFAMPFAIDRYTLVVASERQQARVGEHRVFSGFAGEEVALQLSAPRKLESGAAWQDYVVGTLSLMDAQGFSVPDLNISIHSNLPVGSGLSSSASLELAVATLVEGICERSMDAMEKMLLCQRVEHEYALVPCGLMDQFTVCAGKQNQVLQLDCRTQTAETIALQDDVVRFLIVDSQVRHQHSGGGYSERREECSAAQDALGASLRDVDLDAVAGLTEAQIKQRARHVVTENTRVQEVAEALQVGDYQAVGAAMYASHASLRDDFSVSCPQVDTLVSLAQPLPGVVGARMTGGGFGGSVVVMLLPSAIEEVSQTLSREYLAATGIATEPLPVVAVDGAQFHGRSR